MPFKRFFRRIYWRRWFIAGVLIALLPLIAVIGLRAFTSWRASSVIYSLTSVPERPVAIVFGAQVYPSGRPSAMLADRIRMGAELYAAGKVQAILLTGDNGAPEYNEPEAMRQYALGLGVPSEAIVLDYAGFDTYDSCYRARDVFQVSGAILVTQGFHLDRALLLCNGLGIDAVGVGADALRPNGYSRRSMLSSELREYPATALAMFDLLRGAQPTYLGEPLPIFADASAGQSS